MYIVLSISILYSNKESFVSQVNNDIYSNKLTTDNTAFLYLSDTLEIFFQIYAVVENSKLINTPDFINYPRHYNYYDTYINTDYSTIISYMEKYITPKFISNNGNYDQFFNNNLRCYIITQTLTPAQNEKLNYLKYIYYIKSDINIDYLKNNRMTIYTILI